MIAQGRDDFKIVNDCLAGSSPMNEEAFESAAVLSKRLDKLKKSSILFEGISPSPHFAELVSTEMMSAIC